MKHEIKRGITLAKERIVLLRTVMKSGPLYLILLPREIGEKLHRRKILITIEPIKTKK